VTLDINDQRVLDELSRRFKASIGADRQEYFRRLLDHYLDKERLKGKTLAEVEGIFGPLGMDPSDPTRAYVSVGLESIPPIRYPRYLKLCLLFKDGRILHARYFVFMGC